MFIDFFLDVFEKNEKASAIIWQNHIIKYNELSRLIYEWQNEIIAKNIKKGTVVAIDSEFSPNSVAIFLALIGNGCIVVPISNLSSPQKNAIIDLSQTQFIVSIDGKDKVDFTCCQRKATHPLYVKLRKRGHPGLVLFSSGSTGKNKVMVHDIVPLLEKFKIKRKAYKMLAFLLFDHIGGINTMLYALSNGGCLVAIRERNPDVVLNMIEKNKIELLPTSPTFLNLVLLSGAYMRHDISSLKIISYGTEPMPETTLQRLCSLFPGIKFLQTYGLSEVGILRTKSKSSDSLWVQLGGDGVETRIIEGRLQIRSNSSILGYLNSPSPFTRDGWFDTEDVVEKKGNYYRILGRESDIINVGGRKVYPAEVENVIYSMENVAAVSVFGEKNIVVGSIVCAKIKLVKPEKSTLFIDRLKSHCRDKLENYKIPIKIWIVEEEIVGRRFKQLRLSNERSR